MASLDSAYDATPVTDGDTVELASPTKTAGGSGKLDSTGKGSKKAPVALTTAGSKLTQDWQQYKPMHQQKPSKTIAAGKAGTGKLTKNTKPQVYRGDHGGSYLASAFEPMARDMPMPAPAGMAGEPDPVAHPTGLGEIASGGVDGVSRPPVPLKENDPKHGPIVDHQAGEAKIEGHWQTVAKRLKRELTVTKKRCQAEVEHRMEENMRLKAQVAALKENCDQQAQQIHEQAQALEEIRREGQSELADSFRHNYAAERRAATMQARLGAAAADQERAFAAAANQLEALRRERDTLAEALAAVAEAAVGGPEMTPADVNAENALARAEGADPLPRRPDAWLRFQYSSTPSHGFRDRMGGEGERAVAALVAAIARLKRHRDEALGRDNSAVKQVEQLRSVISRVDEEYQNVANMVEAVEVEMEKLKNMRNIPPLPAVQLKKGLPGRLAAVHHVARMLVPDLQQAEAETKKMSAQLLELDFYSKLHVKLVEQARFQGGGDKPKPASPKKLPPVLSQEEATVKIQAGMRGMQGRKRVNEIKAGARPTSAPTSNQMSKDEAATAINSHIRGHLQRKQVSEKRKTIV
ncbi:hypothetical protein CYMTET_39285 [Cymbomonas tetramitiformis]|uniref:Uncharacterized protein n=1 Tax=Cymbomonas tetramitiformis TaxID=36881 RepID=A0AAE0CAE4_9CHLO|nr:hypothetical protein CYMTET_39285 [Cymbomonas tetramitiformis]